MDAKQQTALKLAGLFGIFSAITFLIGMGLSVYFSPWFSWTENWISEIGGATGVTPIWAARGLSSVIFNISLSLSGIFGVLFSVNLKKSQMFSTNIGKLVTMVMSINMAALFGIGFFPITLGKIHVWSSYTPFLFIPFCLISSGYVLGKVLGKKWSYMNYALSIVSLLSVVVFLQGNSKSISEMIALCSVFMFVTTLSINLLVITSSTSKIREWSTTYTPNYHRFTKNDSAPLTMWFKKIKIF